MGESNVVSASLDERHKKYLDDHDISPTQLMKSRINELMNSDENPYKYTPLRHLSESRKMGLIIMLSGALVLIVSMVVFSYLLPTSKLPAFMVVWVAGCAISYYGFREYGKWNDLIYWRSKAKIAESNIDEKEQDRS